MELNPHLATHVHVVPLAVGAASNGQVAMVATSAEIQPSAKPDPSIPFVSIDSYVRDNDIRVDVCKMAIEGGEGIALRGAERTLRASQPRLMIPIYHGTDDLWMLGEQIQEINPNYVFHFGRHTPIQCASVHYAV